MFNRNANYNFTCNYIRRNQSTFQQQKKHKENALQQQ